MKSALQDYLQSCIFSAKGGSPVVTAVHTTVSGGLNVSYEIRPHLSMKNFPLAKKAVEDFERKMVKSIKPYTFG